VVGARQVGRRFTGRQRQHRSRLVSEDEQVVVGVKALGEAEVLGVEGSRAFAVGDGQGDVVQRHP
jgi:hypothetical protein